MKKYSSCSKIQNFELNPMHILGFVLGQLVTGPTTTRALKYLICISYYPWLCDQLITPGIVKVLLDWSGGFLKLF